MIYPLINLFCINLNEDFRLNRIPKQAILDKKKPNNPLEFINK